MLVRVPQLLGPADLHHCRQVLTDTPWVDGRTTAGQQSAIAKRNLQAPEDAPEARKLGEMILTALGRNETFVSSALPLRVFPPLFNRYDTGMGFGTHVDNSIRFAPGGVRVRTDLSCTLFLTPPEEYDGGELVIEDVFGEQSVKLEAGDLVLYPASSLHRVNPITRGSRWASFFWVQSMVKDDNQRAILHRMDTAIRATRADLSDTHTAVLALTATYHNLVRMWSEV